MLNVLAIFVFWNPPVKCEPIHMGLLVTCEPIPMDLLVTYEPIHMDLLVTCEPIHMDLLVKVSFLRNNSHNN